jgi:hypothetical protein
MYTKEQFHETVGILVRAYMNDTLEHAECGACAVGNIIAAKSPELYNENPAAWYHPLERERPLAKKQLASTGYAFEDVMKIEKAFETCPIPDRLKNTWGNWKDPEWMFNGLMAVVDVLCEIHGMNETEKQESKALFVKV